jgi:hypothetical protein
MDSTGSRVIVTLLLVAAACVGGCGGSNGAGGPGDGGSTSDAVSGTDASLPDASQTDASEGDASGSDGSVGNDGSTGADGNGGTDGGPLDAANEASAPDCGAVQPKGTQIVASTSPVIVQGQGLTSDGYLFYQDYDAQILYAVPSGGGTPESLGKVTSQSGTFHLNGGKGALYLPAASDPVTSVAPLSAWSAASGPNVISTTALGYDSFYYTYDTSPSGSDVVYFEFGNAGGGNTVTLTVSSIDGKTKKSLVSNIDTTNFNCSPMVQFVNSDAFVVTYCLAGVGDAGSTGDVTLAVFSGATFKPTTLAKFASPGQQIMPPPLSPDGTKFLVPDPAGALALYPIVGGAPTTIDPNAAQGFFTPAGGVVYARGDGALILYRAGQAPVTLVKSGVSSLLALSPDGDWLEAAENVDPKTGGMDIYIGSATKAGSLTPAWTKTTASVIGFSADSKYEAFATNMPTTFGIPTFDLNVSPVASPSKPVKLLKSAGQLMFTTGSKLVTNTNATAATGAADIEGIDLAALDAGSTLVTQADPNFVYAKSSNKIFYSWYCAPTASAGVWVVSAP